MVVVRVEEVVEEVGEEDELEAGAWVGHLRLLYLPGLRSKSLIWTPTKHLWTGQGVVAGMYMLMTGATRAVSFKEK